MSSEQHRRPDADDPAVDSLLARCHFPPPGSVVTCAISGGADSTALLALAVAAALDVTAVHVDHGLRPESSDDAEFVARLAAGWGVRSRIERVEVDGGANLEARARAARRGVLPEGTLYGHTADDLAETVLLRMLRGTGPSGLAAMDAGTHPLLGLRRAETVALCAHLGVVPIQDPTNVSPRFTRNRVRHEVLPLLEDVAGRDVVPLLCRLAELAGEDAELIEQIASGLDPTDASAMSTAPVAMASAAFRMWWQRVTSSAYPPDREAIGRVLVVAAGEARACDVARGWRVARSAGRLRLEAPEADRSGSVAHPGLTSSDDE